MYRLDKDNFFLRDKRNISGTTFGVPHDHIDAMSIKFYQFIGRSGGCDIPSINNVPLYQLYPRQLKLKLEGVLKSAYRIKNFLNDTDENIEIITDRQTVSIMKEAFLFLGYKPTNVTWKVNALLTVCITINSLIMRFAAIVKMYTSSSNLPNEYFYKHVNPNAPTVLITTPKDRSVDFFSMYVENFSSQFNVVLYSFGVLPLTPDNYKRIKFKKSAQVLQGIQY